WKTKRLISSMRRLDHVRLLFAPQAVLRRENRSELTRESLGQQIAGVVKGTINRRLVHEQAKVRAAENGRRLCEAAFEAELNGHVIHTASTSAAGAGSH